MRKVIILISVLIITFLSSCTSSYRYIYTATPPNNPYFIEKGESKLAGYYSNSWGNGATATKFSGGLDLQGAYALTNHWAVAAGYLNRREMDAFNRNYDEDYYIRYKRNLFDLATGYFLALDKKKVVTANLYGGFAFGKFSFKDEKDDKFHESSITKPYLQPSINFMPTPNFHMSIGSRISFVHYGNIKTSYTPDELDKYHLTGLDNRTITYFEPAFNMQFGVRDFPGFKIDFTLSGTSKPFHTDRILLFSRNANMSIGLSFDLSKMGKKE